MKDKIQTAIEPSVVFRRDGAPKVVFVDQRKPIRQINRHPRLNNILSSAADSPILFCHAFLERFNLGF